MTDRPASLFDDFTGPAPHDPTVLSLAGIADELGLTERRVRQLEAEGHLVARRGGFDVTHAALAAWGRKVLGALDRDRRDLFVDAAAGWLAAHAPAAVHATDITAWRKAAARWGLDDDQALAVLMLGRELLGRAAPRIDLNPRAPSDIDDDGDDDDTESRR